MHAGWDPVADYDGERFERDLVDKVEPALPRDRPVILIDYPAAAAALSRRKPGHETVAERWELYIDGVEIANAFSELTDAVEQRARFEGWAAERRAAGRTVYPLDEDFLAALKAGMPPAGVPPGFLDRTARLRPAPVPRPAAAGSPPRANPAPTGRSAPGPCSRAGTGAIP